MYNCQNLSVEVRLVARTVESIREAIGKHRGSRIFYRAANGRRKIEERSGVIKETYPSLFTVYIDAQRSTISFSYTDVLTKEVELQLESNGELIL